MDKLDFLFKFRRANNDETLEKMVEHMDLKVSQSDYAAFQSAADHRRAELACKRGLKPNRTKLYAKYIF
ncbi:hypothetical protein LHL26_004105 [Salmonella enterica]|nr:hypothetical protein [Salmonella enterica]